MAIGNITSDYTGRKKDLHIMQGVDPSGEAVITPSFGRVSNFCAGVQKLVQRYTIALLTELGSQTAFPDFGTNFMSRISSRSTRLNKSDVTNLFNLASGKVINSFRAYQAENPGTPNDESINTALLQDIVVGADFINFKIKLYTQAGSVVDFISPIPKAIWQ